MRRLFLALVFSCALGSSTGCFLPIYSSDPVERTKELIITSENFRSLVGEWKRFWFLDQPSTLTPYHTHGGIL